MSIKRKADAQGDPTQLYTSKRRQAPKNHDSRPRVDPNAGQAAAFPGLDQSIETRSGHNLGHSGLPDDPMAYMRSVRAEAAAIPSLLVASANNDGGLEPGPAESVAGRNLNRTTSHFSDGVYVAAPKRLNIRSNKGMKSSYGHATGDGDGNEEEAASEQRRRDEDGCSEHESEAATFYSAKDAYTTGLLEYFAATRESIRSKSSAQDSTPDPEAGSSALHKTLTTGRLRAADLNKMTNYKVLRLLEALTEHLEWDMLMESHAQTLHKWAWALLLKLDDVGTLSTEEVGTVRDLGKQALLCLGREVDEQQRKDQVGAERARREEDENEDEAEANAKQPRRRRNTSSSISGSELASEDEGAPKEKAAFVRRGRSKLSGSGYDEADAEESVRSAAFFTLDMIITIVGEVYGQQDLLDGRLLSWMPVE